MLCDKRSGPLAKLGNRDFADLAISVSLRGALRYRFQGAPSTLRALLLSESSKLAVFGSGLAAIASDPPPPPKKLVCMPASRTPHFLAWLVTHRRSLLVLGLLFAGGAFAVGSHLQLDRSIERMFADDDPILQPYRALQETFGQHEIAIAVYSDAELSSEQGLARVGAIAEQARGIPGVVAAVSLLDPPGAANLTTRGEARGSAKFFRGTPITVRSTLRGSSACLLVRSRARPRVVKRWSRYAS